MNEKIRRHGFGLLKNLLPVSLVAGIPLGAEAATIDLQNAAQAHANLIHRWSFDGADNASRRLDQRGTAHLNESVGGTGTAANIGYGAAGFDATSSAATTFRAVPGSDNTGGAAFRNPSIVLGMSTSFEVLFRPSVGQITGGTFNLGYILSTRVGGNRGYFLLQGSSEAGSDGNDLSSIIGLFAPANQQTLLETIVAGNWYYAAGSYTSTGTDTTFTSYVADLTAGQTTLTSLGPITVPGTFQTGPTATPVGIGARWDGAGEAFPGDIDEVNVYNAALDAATFQSHLDQLLIPEPSSFALLSLGLLSIFRRRRPASGI